MWLWWCWSPRRFQFRHRCPSLLLDLCHKFQPTGMLCVNNQCVCIYEAVPVFVRAYVQCLSLDNTGIKLVKGIYTLCYMQGPNVTLILEFLSSFLPILYCICLSKPDNTCSFPFRRSELANNHILRHFIRSVPTNLVDLTNQSQFDDVHDLMPHSCNVKKWAESPWTLFVP